MDMVEEYLEKYKVGFPTFEKLFNLKKDELLKILRELCSHDVLKKPMFSFQKITVMFINLSKTISQQNKNMLWSTIEVTPTGIYYKPEHGTGKDIVLSNKFFTLSLE